MTEFTGALCGAGPAAERLPMNTELDDSGFGFCCILKNGRMVWALRPNARRRPTVRFAEKLARNAERDVRRYIARPRRDRWIILFVSPWASSEYERAGPNRWVLVREGRGVID